jgi:TorA maturation chaperone TorD
MKEKQMLHVSERKLLYRFLARLFSYPDQELLDTLARGEADEMARLVGVESPPSLDAADPLQDLEVGFTEQFINRLGGIPAPPYGSVYLEQDGILMGQSSLRALEAYRAEDLSLEGGGEPPDYLATELEFLFYLVSQEEEALSRRDVEGARDKTVNQRAFVSELLHPWVSVFCSRVENDQHSHSLYLWGGRLLEKFCTMEKDWLGRLP